MTDAAPIRVLQSFSRPQTSTNPYMVMLFQRLQATPDVEPIRVWS